MHLLKPTVAFLVTLLVAGCGGGGDEPMSMRSAQVTAAGDPPSVVDLKAGQATAIEGTVSSTRYVLKSADWQVTDTYPNTSLALTLDNADCAIAVKQDWFDPVLPGSGIGRSTWVCKVQVTAPIVGSETLYTLTLSGVDYAGNRQNLQHQVRVIP